MEKFEDLESLYNHLEQNALDYKYMHQIADLFKNLIEIKKEEDIDEAEKARWMMSAFYFDAIDGKLGPTIKTANKSGKEKEVTIFDNFDERAYKFFNDRLAITENPLLKSRYAHILWTAKKHGSYAHAAVDSYLEIAEFYKLNEERENSIYWANLIWAIKNAYFISKKIKDPDRMTLTKHIINDLVTDQDIKSDMAFLSWVPLIKLMLEDNRNFSKDDFRGIEAKCYDDEKSFLASEHYTGAIILSQLGERVETKLGSKIYDWQRLAAECYEVQMITNEKDSLKSLYFCTLAMEIYNKIKDTTKINDLGIKYAQLKKSIQLNGLGYKIDITDYIRSLQPIVENVLSKDHEEIIKILMFSSILLPQCDEVEKLASYSKNQHPICDAFPTARFDDNVNIAENFSSEDEKFKSCMLEAFDHCLKLKLYLINEILIRAIKERKLTSTSFINFIRTYSKFGQIKEKAYPGGEKTCTWLSLLEPSISNYFDQVNCCVATGNALNLVLPIDSLTLKLEGLIRDLCEINNIATIKPDPRKSCVIREKDINTLLYEPKIKTIFEAEDLLFFKFLLIEQSGLNLRNKVAHAFLVYDQYNLSYMNLLIIALFRLTKYSILE